MYKCKEKEYVASYSREYWKKNPKRKLLNGARGSAKRKGLEFTITEDDFDIPMLCPILGKPISLFAEDREWTVSLDRVDNTKGYVPGNVWVISHRANRLKSDATIEELRLIISALS